MIRQLHHEPELVPPVVIEEVTDPVEIEKARIREEKFRKNLDWFSPRAGEIYRTHRGKCICVAGQELFVADSPREALARARQAHPEDDGMFTRLIPLEKLSRIYATRR